MGLLIQYYLMKIKETFQDTLNKALARLAETGRGEQNHLIKYAVDLGELKSSLRERIFTEDFGRGSRDTQVNQFIESL